jgi:threonine synthase
MDVGAPSNLERLRWLFPEHAKLRAAVDAVSVDDDGIRGAIHATRDRYGEVVCPHTATAMHELMRRRDGGRPRAVDRGRDLRNPAKFETIVEPLLGASVQVPRFARGAARGSRA